MANEWPLNNNIGYCLCGHEQSKHIPIMGMDQQTIQVEQIRCVGCQCVSFALDTWGTIQ